MAKRTGQQKQVKAKKVVKKTPAKSDAGVKSAKKSVTKQPEVHHEEKAVHAEHAQPKVAAQPNKRQKVAAKKAAPKKAGKAPAKKKTAVKAKKATTHRRKAVKKVVKKTVKKAANAKKAVKKH